MVDEAICAKDLSKAEDILKKHKDILSQVTQRTKK